MTTYRKAEDKAKADRVSYGCGVGGRVSDGGEGWGTTYRNAEEKEKADRVSEGRGGMGVRVGVMTTYRKAEDKAKASMVS